MEASNLQIYWHESQPIYSLCFQSTGPPKARRLVTAGGDNRIRVWQLNFEERNAFKVDSIDFLSSLTQHEQAVNVVRFNSTDDILATAGDDGQLLLWKKNDSMAKEFGVDEEEFADFKESWHVWKRLRPATTGGASEIYDLCWSPDDNYIVTGSMDNSVRVFDVNEGSCVASAVDHNHYVQGVAWDPQNEFILSQSADRSVHLHKLVRDASGAISGLKFSSKITKGDLPCRKAPNSTELELDNVKSAFLFHNETLPSFFRRLAISPCGNLVCVPAGIFKNCDSQSESGNGNDELANAVYLFTRAYLEKHNNRPSLVIPFLKKPALVISFNPHLYQLSKQDHPCVKLPYKLLFAVATSDEVLIYDTETAKPVCIVGNLHYTPITDLSWSKDGAMLMISSTDGFCSYISFKNEMLGNLYDNEVQKGIQTNEAISTAPIKKPSIVNILPIKRKSSPRDKNPTEQITSAQVESKVQVQQASNISKPSDSHDETKSTKRRVKPTLLL